MHRTLRLTTALAASALVAAGLSGVAGTATAADGADGSASTLRETLARGLVSPLTAAVTPKGAVYITENFAGKLVKKAPGRKIRTVYTARRPTEVGAVSVRKGVVTFSLTAKKSKLVKQIKGGEVTTLANVGKFEREHNPDADVTYGFREISDECAADLPAEIGPASYPGIIDSHPYATASIGKVTYLADAAANAILRISPRGAISIVTVLPAVPVEITAEGAQANGLPDCTVGLTYWFESVPTDVERAPGGQLVVSTLTGGPEDGSLGPQSKVYGVDPDNGAATEVAGGLAGAVGVAVAPDGDIFVSQLFGNKLSRIQAGSSTPQNYRKAVMPAAVEWTRKALYVTTNVLVDPPAGKLVRFRF